MSKITMTKELRVGFMVMTQLVRETTNILGWVSDGNIDLMGAHDMVMDLIDGRLELSEVEDE